MQKIAKLGLQHAQLGDLVGAKSLARRGQLIALEVFRTMAEENIFDHELLETMKGIASAFARARRHPTSDALAEAYCLLVPLVIMKAKGPGAAFTAQA